jgi:glycosyltransferase involved in cell wall biosynthesis
MMTKRRIVVSVETLLSGGAESFAIRLANSLCSQFDVYLVVIQGRLIDVSVANKLKVGVHLVKVIFSFEWLIQKFDSIFLRLGVDISIRNFLTRDFLRRFLSSNQIEIIHSNQFKVDYIFSLANTSLGLPQVITVHGDYLNFSERNRKGELGILQFDKKAKQVLNAVDKIVFISDHQREFLRSTLGPQAIDSKIVKIYNGVEIEPVGSVSPSRVEFAKKDFVFGMVARGIKEKGWEEAIKSFIKLHVPGLQLVLVGKSAYLDELKKKYPHEDIHFVGYSENPGEWIELFDVGLLPSTFASESLPTSVIEYIVMGKPAIASDKGEIRNMLQMGVDRCGIVLEVKNDRVDESELAEAMKLLWGDKKLYQVMARNTRKFATYFDMKNCLNAYVGVYDSLTQNQS